MTSVFAADLSLALELADAADALTMDRYQALDLRVESKPDSSPVTDADIAVEKLIRTRVEADRPADGFVGEESGVTLPDAVRRWVIDPIDGTKNFARGVPVWATLIALESAGEVVVGVASAPALGRRWWASAGDGAWATGPGAAAPARLTVSGVNALADASLSFSGIGGWAEHGRLPQFLELAQSVWRTRGYGDFWSHLLVAEGAIDLGAEPDVTHWDLAALDVIVREAGGCFTDLAGRPGPAGGSALSSNGLLHDVALAMLTG